MEEVPNYVNRSLTDDTEIGGGTDSSDVAVSDVLETTDSSDVVGIVLPAATVLAQTTGMSLRVVLIDCDVLVVVLTLLWVASGVTTSPDP